MCACARAQTHTHTQLFAKFLTQTSKNYADKTMNLLKFYQTTLFNEYLITPISHMQTQHYACVVVLPEYNLA